MSAVLQCIKKNNLLHTCFRVLAIKKLEKRFYNFIHIINILICNI